MARADLGKEVSPGLKEAAMRGLRVTPGAPYGHRPVPRMDTDRCPVWTQRGGRSCAFVRVSAFLIRSRRNTYTLVLRGSCRQPHILERVWRQKGVRVARVGDRVGQRHCHTGATMGTNAGRLIRGTQYGQWSGRCCQRATAAQDQAWTNSRRVHLIAMSESWRLPTHRIGDLDAAKSHAHIGKAYRSA